MIHYLTKYPAKPINRLLFLIGAIIFIPVYYYNYQKTLEIMDIEILKKLMMSFNSSTFKDIIMTINERSHINILFSIYVLNILTMIGFMLLAFSLTLSIARMIKSDSMFYKVGFYPPIMVLVISLLDFIPSILFLFIAKNVNNINAWMVFTIDLCYVIRTIMIYIIFSWILVSSTILLIIIVKNWIKSI